MAMDAGSEPKARIFISYSRKDRAFADRLDSAIRARGFEMKTVVLYFAFADQLMLFAVKASLGVRAHTFVSFKRQ
jgi:hypothetical protein